MVALPPGGRIPAGSVMFRHPEICRRSPLVFRDATLPHDPIPFFTCRGRDDDVKRARHLVAVAIDRWRRSGCGSSEALPRTCRSFWLPRASAIPDIISIPSAHTAGRCAGGDRSRPIQVRSAKSTSSMVCGIGAASAAVVDVSKVPDGPISHSASFLAATVGVSGMTDGTCSVPPTTPSSPSSCCATWRPRLRARPARRVGLGASIVGSKSGQARPAARPHCSLGESGSASRASPPESPRNSVGFGRNSDLRGGAARPIRRHLARTAPAFRGVREAFADYLRMHAGGAPGDESLHVLDGPGRARRATERRDQAGLEAQDERCGRRGLAASVRGSGSVLPGQARRQPCRPARSRTQRRSPLRSSAQRGAPAEAPRSAAARW